MIIGTAGHIDHGKTTLVRALTGVDTDRLPAERARGITIELGFAPILLDGITASIVDVPGHEALVRTMIAGAAGIDVALLVVAADDGIRPQTREHLDILELLGVDRGVVALTKCDRVSASRIDDVRAAVRATLLGRALHAAPIIDCVAPDGVGIAALRTALSSIGRELAPRQDDAHARLPIDRVLTVTGVGTVVTGTLWSGHVRDGQALTLMPDGQCVRVRGLQSHGRVVAQAEAGQRIAIALAGLGRDAVRRGDVLVAGPHWQATSVLRADVRLLPDRDVAITARSRVRLHLGTHDVGARLVATPPLGNSDAWRAVRIVLDEPIVARGGDRLVIRRPSPPTTIGGGVITDAAPSEGRVRPFSRAALAPGDRLAELVEESRGRGVRVDTLPLRLGLSSDRLASLNATSPPWVTIDDHLVSRHRLDACVAQLESRVSAWHALHPSSPGLPIAASREGLGAAAPLEAVLALTEGRLVIEAQHVRRSDWRPRRDPIADRDAAAVLAQLQTAGLATLAEGDLVAQHGPRVRDTLRTLSRDGEVVSIGHGRWTTPTTVAELAQRLWTTMIPLRDYTASELRDVFGVSRKYLIPWLEYCDREGITLRHGDLRRLGGRASRLARPDS